MNFINKNLKNLGKALNKLSPIHGWVLFSFVCIVVLYYLFYKYSDNKNNIMDNMNQLNNDVGIHNNDLESSLEKPADAQSLSNQYEKIDSVSPNTQGLPPSCNAGNVPDPKELLPKDENNQWSKLNPSGSGGLENINLLKSGYHAGVDTVGSSLRNANLQVRSEPPNPTNKVSPWLNSTIEPDLMRVPLEIGCGSQ
jgi:hypothetical protein